jgi:hypothetical protein
MFEPHGNTLEYINSNETILSPFFAHGVLESKLPDHLMKDFGKIQNENYNKKENEAKPYICLSSEDGKYCDCSEYLTSQIIKYIFDISQKYLHTLRIDKEKIEKINLKKAYFIRKNEKDYLKSYHREGRMTALACLKAPEKEGETSNGYLDFIYGSNSEIFLNIIGGNKAISLKNEYIYVYPSWLTTVLYPTYSPGNSSELVEFVLT